MIKMIEFYNLSAILRQKHSFLFLLFSLFFLGLPFRSFAQNGTSGSPYTSMLQAACNTTAGVKFFNIGGQSFSTYVDAQGYILVANEITGTVIASTGLSPLQNGLSISTNQGILPSAVVATLTATSQIKFTNNTNVTATSTDAGNISRLLAYKAIDQGDGTAASNMTWVQTGSYLTQFGNASGTSGASGCNTATYYNVNLTHVILHACGNQTGITWDPYASGSGGSVGTFTTVSYSAGRNTGGTFQLWVHALVPSAIGANKTICNGQSTALTATCSTGTLEWYTNNAGTGSTVPSPVTPTATTSYYPFCNNGTCKGPVGEAQTITVNPSPVLTQTPTNTTICSGGTFSTAVKSTLAGTYSATATVQSGTVSGATAIPNTSLPTANTAVTYTSGNITNTGTTDAVVRYVFTPVATTGSCTGATVTQDVIIKASPVITTTPLTVCSGTAFSETPTSNQAGTTYTWTAPTQSSGVTGGSSQTTGVAAPISQTLTYTGATQGTATYTLTPFIGTCAGATKTFVVTVNPLPTAPTGITASTLCSGAIINLSGTCASTSTLTWYSDSGLTTTVSTSQTPTTTTQYYATCVNNTTGCKSTSVTKTVTVNPKPTVTVTSNTAICNGSNTTLTAGGATSYVWNPATGLSATTGSSVTANPTATTTYTVTGTGANGCTNTATTTVTVNNNPTATIAKTDVSCFGLSDGTATATASNGTGPYTYAWSPSGGTSATAAGLAAGTYSCLITDSNGCTTAPSVTINQPSQIAGPTALTATPTTVCQGNSTTLGGNCSAGTLTWYSDAGLTTVISATQTPTANTTYYAACVSGACKSVSANISVVVTPTPPTPAGAASPTTLCSGGTSNLNATCSSGTLKWYASTDLTTALASTAITKTVSSQTTYNYVAYCEAGLCKGSGLNASITFNPNPTAPTVIPSSSKVCSGNTITLSASGCTGTVSWFESGSSTVLGTNSSYTTPVLTNNTTASTYKTYEATCTINGCTSVSASAQSVLEILPIPTAPNISTSQSSICVGSSITLTGSNCNANLEWSKDGGTTTFYTGLSTTQTLSTVGTVTYSAKCVSTSGSVNAVSCVAPAVNSISVVVNALPLKPTITPSSASICIGASATLNTTCQSGETASWSNGKSGNSITETPNTTTSYTVKCINTTTGCESPVSDPVTITVNPLPTVTISSKTDVKCKGESTGSATATASSGTSPYTYSWSPSGGSSATASGLSAGTYTVSVLDNNGCAANTTTTINEPTAVLSATVTQTDVLCKGASTGSVSITPSGGTAPYTITPAQTGLAAGDYSFIIKDANNCSITKNVTIVEPASEITIAPTITHPKCFGETGSVSFITNGGTGSITITPATQTGLAAGTHTFTAKDANNCTKTVDVIINAAPSEITITPTITQPKCVGETGSVSFVAIGGTGTITITPATQTGLAAGTHTFTAKDANNCTKTIDVVINAVPSAIVMNATITQPACFGQKGSVSIIASGGTGTITISPNTYDNLSSGDHVFIATDANGCTQPKTITINPVPATIVITPTVTQPICPGQTGSVSFATSGGTGVKTISPSTFTGLTSGSYTYIATDENGCTANSTISINTIPNPILITPTIVQPKCFGETGSVSFVAGGGTGTISVTPATQTNLATGNHIFTATDANGCTKNETITINPAPGPIVINITVTQPVCSYGKGSVTITTSGGTGIITISPTTMTNLSADSYLYTATDANGCSKDTTIIITAPAAIPVTVTSNTAICNGSNTTLTAGGATSYVWNPATGLSATTGSSVTANPTATTTYTVTGTGANGCTNTATTTVTVNNNPTATIAKTDVSCFGLSDGTATATASNGTGPYTYAWSPSGGTSATAAGLAAGTYSCLITDSNGCTTAPSVTINQPSQIAGPTALTATPTTVCQGNSTTLGGNCSAGTLTWYSDAGLTTVISATQTPTANTTYYAACVSGACKSVSANISVVVTPTPPTPAGAASPTTLCSGGTSNLNATCSSGTLKWYASTDLTTALASTAITKTVSSQTTYNYVAYCEAGLCKGSGLNASITFNPNPTAPTVIPSSSKVCSGNTITLSASGCTGTVSWFESGSSTVLGTNSSYTTPVLTNNTTASTYKTYEATCTINGCTSVSASAQSVLEILPIPTAPNISTSQSSICVGSSITLTGSNCNANLEWSKDGGTTTFYTGLSTTQTLSTVGTVTYSAKCVSTSGSVNAVSCVAPAVNSISVVVNALPLKPTITPSSASICIGASATLNTTCQSGETASWSNGKSGNSITETPNTTTSYTVKCINTTTGCESPVSDPVTITVNPLPTVTISSKTDVKCKGESTGSATATASSGTSPYTYSWSPSGGSSATASGLSAGTYTVSVLDNNGCAANTTTTINEPTAVLSATVTQTDVLCKGASTGSVSITPSGGTAPYTITPAQTGLAAGDYSFIIKDANNCSITKNVTIVEPTNVLSITVTPTQPTCFGQKGSVTVTTGGGTGSITVLPTSVNNLAAGNYTYTATDANNCTQLANVTINAAPSEIVFTPTITHPICPGQTGSVTFAPTGGTGTITVSPSTQTNLAGGTYNYTATDASNCKKDTTITINAAPNPIVINATVTQPACSGQKGSVSITTSGGTGTISITPAIFDNLATGVHQYTATDVFGCSNNLSITITEPSAITLPSISSATSSFCAGTTNLLTATGCSGTVTWLKDGTTLTPTGNTYSATVGGSYTATCTVSGCTSLESQSVSITLKPLPTATASNSCSGSIITLTAANAQAGATYSWTGPNSYSASAQNPTAFPYNNNNLIGNYVLVVTLDGCTAQSTTNVSCDAMPLPVKLISFTGINTKEGVLLNWKTSEEINFKAFEVQRSLDAKAFETIGLVYGFSNSETIKQYSFLDTDIKNGIYYYRLKEIDNDGTYDFSTIISIQINAENAFVIYPNPVYQNFLTFDGLEIKEANLLNLKGELVGKLKINNNQINLPNNIMAGLYHLQLFTINKVILQKIIIQK